MFAFQAVTAIFTASGVQHLIRRCVGTVQPRRTLFAARARSARLLSFPTAVLRNEATLPTGSFSFRRGGHHVPVTRNS